MGDKRKLDTEKKEHKKKSKKRIRSEVEEQDETNVGVSVVDAATKSINEYMSTDESNTGKQQVTLKKEDDDNINKKSDKKSKKKRKEKEGDSQESSSSKKKDKKMKEKKKKKDDKQEKEIKVESSDVKIKQETTEPMDLDEETQKEETKSDSKKSKKKKKSKQEDEYKKINIDNEYSSTVSITTSEKEKETKENTETGVSEKENKKNEKQKKQQTNENKSNSTKKDDDKKPIQITDEESPSNVELSMEDFEERVLADLTKSKIPVFHQLFDPSCSKDLPVNVYFLDSYHVSNRALEIVKKHAGISWRNISVIGFDTETFVRRGFSPNSKTFSEYKDPETAKSTVKVFDIRRAPSMVQIAISNHIIMLFSVYRMCHNVKRLVKDIETGEACDIHTWKLDKFPPVLKEMIQSHHILKVGVGAANDAHELEQFFKIKSKNILGLDVLAKSLRLPRTGLAPLVYTYNPAIIMNKSRKFIFTNWDALRKVIPIGAIEYAARDALYSLKLFADMVCLPKFPVPETFPDFKNLEQEDESGNKVENGGVSNVGKKNDDGHGVVASAEIS